MIFFSMYLILPGALGPGVHSASNRNEYQYQKQKNNILVSRALPVGRADNLTAICDLNVGSLTSHNPIGLQDLLRG
jgi:hypothetical protein